MLQVYLLLNGLPQDAPGFAGLLQALHQSMRLNLTVINNGQPFSPKRMFHQLGLTCRLIEYPLRFHPAQVLANQLSQRKPRNAPKIENTLWFEDSALWHPGHLPAWLAELENWSWIAPRLLPGNTLPQTRQIYQVQALSRPAGEPKLQALVPEVFPPCFCFGPDAIPLLKEWISPEGQLPLLMMPACDTAAPAWHATPASTHHEAALTIDEALARWQEILNGAESPRQQALLESLQRALPDSPAVYARLAPLLDPAEAVELLEIALRRRLFYPELLALMVQALIACYQPELAALYLRHLQQRFAAFEMPVSPWPGRKGAGLRLHPEALPRQARLSVAVLAFADDTQLEACLTSLRGLEAEWLVIDPDANKNVAAIAAAHGAQLCRASADDIAAARNQAIELASGDWMLMLDADETLDPKGLPVLRRMLADPPPGLPCFWLPIEEPATGTHSERRRYALKLFPRHPLLRYEGRVCEHLSYQGPGEAGASLLAGLSLRHNPQAQRQLARLAQLRAEPLEALAQAGLCCAVGELEAEAGDSESALAAYQRALTLEDSVWQAVAAVGALEALLALERPQQALELARAQEKVCQDLPDYWYLRGLAAQTLGEQEDEAMSAFERSLNRSAGSGQPALGGPPYPGPTVPERAGRLPLSALAEAYRSRMHDPRQQPHQRQQAAQQLLGILQQLLQSAPAAELLGQNPFVFIRLAQAALVSARMQPGIGPSALALYNDYLPPEAAHALGAYYAETALLYLEGRPESLQDRLPADYHFETIKDLQLKPYTLMAFCQELWDRSEIDGPELVTALLSLAAQAQQDLSLWLQLSHLYKRSGQPEIARLVLNDARLQLPANPYLLSQLARIELELGAHATAQRLLSAALALRPDLEEALHLQQELTASRRRKRYSEFQSSAKENGA